MSLLKDLLYTRNNEALDISRLCSLLAVLTFLGCVVRMAIVREFDPMAVGGGIAALFAGCAGWIFARQAKEDG